MPFPISNMNQSRLFPGNLWIALLILLFLISLFINLGQPALFNEEPRRALITLEMEYNGNFLVPTQAGEYYYNKPPLFNWVILFFFKVFGVSEFALRIITVLSLIVLCVMIFIVVKKYLDSETALAAALLFGISGDIYYSFST